MTQQSANLGSFVSSLYSEDYDLMSRSVIDQVVEPDRAVLIPEFDKVKMISKIVALLQQEYQVQAHQFFLYQIIV